MATETVPSAASGVHLAGRCAVYLIVTVKPVSASTARRFYQAEAGVKSTSATVRLSGASLGAKFAPPWLVDADELMALTRAVKTAMNERSAKGVPAPARGKNNYDDCIALFDTRQQAGHLVVQTKRSFCPGHG